MHLPCVSVCGVVLALGLCGCNRADHGPVSANPHVTNGPALFEDITARVGLNFMHESGADGSYFMPEHVGSGAAFFDYDNDGRLDLLLIQCADPNGTNKNRLYHHESNGSLRDVSAGSGLDVAGYGMGVAVGDVNNDGWPDVLITEYGRIRLFLNNGNGTFK